ncbi:zinc finger protein Xfin-like [Sander lucioperca]|uniref:zinc finger protein Xfin-like n=1 Tax=Sander lucioperca TaxID=283035 RepID=UPI0016534342|nr:zinc finger protein Xfin-like [Sander lucioperca]
MRAHTGEEHFTGLHMGVKQEPPHIKEEADREDCGGPEPAKNSHLDVHFETDTEDETSDSSETEKECEDPNGKPFRCSVCAKTFKHRGNLNIHMRTHTGEKPFRCSFCGKTFTQKAGLDYHLRTHTGEKPFSCSVCGKTFRNKGGVTYHMATHTGLKAFSCGTCKKRFRAASQLRVHKCISEHSELHRRRSEAGRKPLSCSECDATFPNNYLLVTHMRMHKGKKLFTCSICGQKRQFSSHLAIHMRTHTGEKPYSCSVCGKTFSQRGIMSQHMAVHSGVKPFSCGVCGRRFYWHFQIKKHKCLGAFSQRRRAGFNGENYGGAEAIGHLTAGTYRKTEASPETEVDVEFWKETRQHQSGFTYRRNKKVRDGCNTETAAGTEQSVEPSRHPQSGPDALKAEHVSTGDTEEKPFSFSEHQEKREDTLLTHHNSPAEEKPFSFCGKAVYTGGKALSSGSVCEKGFTVEPRHIGRRCVGESSQLHAADRLLGRGFNRKHQLQVPIRLHAALKGRSVRGKTFPKRGSSRAAETAFRCSVCDAAFGDSEALVQHMRIHTRQTQFSCAVCGKEFAWRRYLTKHMEVHTKESLDSLHWRQTEHTETEADGEDCGGPEPARNSHPHPLLQPETEDQTGDSSEPETDDSADWKETREPQSALNSLKHESRCKKTFSCSECGRRFGCKTNLRRHTRIHTGEKRFSCGFCNERFARRPQFQEHKCVGRQTEENREAEPPSRNSHPHTLVQPETDDSADSDFWKETRERPKPESGDSVDSDFWKDDRKPQSGLDSPNNSDGGSENEVRCDNPLRKPFGCPECGKRFLNLCNLKNHTKYHTGERAFFCSVCGLKCLYRSHLKIHMRTHTGEKPFPCPVCGKKYAHKASMQSHMAAVHTVEKRYSCSICDQGFAWYTELKYHQCVGDAADGHT